MAGLVVIYLCLVLAACRSSSATGPSDVTGAGGVTSTNSQALVVNVKDVGAKGDGVTDDTAAFVAALAAANTRGQCVSVPAGTYILSHVPLFTGQRFCLVGAGMGQTTIRHASSATMSLFDSTARSGTNIVSSFALRNLTIDGNMANITQRSISPVDIRADNGEISRCEFYGTIKAAIRLRAVTDSFVIERNQLHDFQLHNGITGDDTTAVLINKDTPSTGTVRVTGNTFSMSTPPSGAGNSVGGVAVNPDADKNQTVEIDNNVFRNMGQDIAGNTMGAVYLYKNADGSTIHDNQSYNNYAIAISVQRSSHYEIYNNLISGEGTMGSNVSGAIRIGGRKPVTPMTDASIRDNVISDVPSQDCIATQFDLGGEMTGLTVVGNKCDRARRGVYATYVRDGFTLANNSFTNLSGAVCTAINLGSSINPCQ